MDPSQAHMKARASEKEQTIARLEQAMSFIEGQSREPDQWERVCLTEGIACVFHGMYRLARMEAFEALTEKENRSERLPLPEYHSTLQQLKEALGKTHQLPVEPHPILEKRE